MSLAEKIGKTIKTLRHKRGLSQERMANEAGIDRRYLWDIEAGRRNISMDVLERLSRYFAVSPAEFLNYAEHVDYDELSIETLKYRLAKMSGDEASFFTEPSYITAVVGVSEDGRVVYDYQRMIDFLVLEDKMTSDEAIEFIDYNTLRTIPYMGEKAPIIIYNLEP